MNQSLQWIVFIYSGVTVYICTLKLNYPTLLVMEFAWYRQFLNMVPSFKKILLKFNSFYLLVKISRSDLAYFSRINIRPWTNIIVVDYTIIYTYMFFLSAEYFFPCLVKSHLSHVTFVHLLIGGLCLAVYLNWDRLCDLSLSIKCEQKWYVTFLRGALRVRCV